MFPFSPLTDLRARAATLGADVRAMLEIRLELAQLELRVAVRQCVRLIVTLALFGTLGVAGVGVLAVLLAELLQHWANWSWTQSLALVGASLVLLCLLGSFLAVRIFRRRFTGLEATLAELREDLLWLDELRR